jgi:nicotinamidase-related amidase
MKTPRFYKSDLANQLYIPRYSQIEGDVQELLKEFIPCKVEKNALFLIDAQVCFCMPGASLYVPGAQEDMERICRFILNNMEKLTNLYFSLDTHTAHQIFHSAFWEDHIGNNPPPMTMISYEDVVQKKWIPRFAPEFAKNYVQQLEEEGKYKLIIWPYHGQKGAVDSALLPILSEVAFFHSRMHGYDPEYIIKGESFLTESYSVLRSEIQTLTSGEEELQIGESHPELVKSLLLYDKVYIAGEASSHCVLATLKDLVRNVKTQQLLKKIYILEDCMSPVDAIGEMNFPAMAKQALKEFQAVGINVIKSTDRL